MSCPEFELWIGRVAELPKKEGSDYQQCILKNYNLALNNRNLNHIVGNPGLLVCFETSLSQRRIQMGHPHLHHQSTVITIQGCLENFMLLFCDIFMLAAIIQALCVWIENIPSIHQVHWSPTLGSWIGLPSGSIRALAPG
jgi:hypothetical protein